MSLTADPRRHTAVLFVLLLGLLLGALLTAQRAVAAKRESPPGGRAMEIPHRPGGRATGDERSAGISKSYLGHDAGEPTMGVGNDGIPFVAAAEALSLSGEAPDVDVMRGDAANRTWAIVSPRVADEHTHSHTGDPYVFVDNHSEGSRIFTIDLQLFACSLLSFSDDGGDSWITNPFGCGRPVNDHQTLFSAPPVSSQTIGYPNVLYYCFHDVVSSSCTKSLDGGFSFVATSGFSFTNEDEFCGGLHGHGFGDAEGTIYIPKVHCGEPLLAISRDEGATWTRVKVADLPAAGHEASVATDGAGNIYYAFIGRDLLPYLVRSRDGGETWSRPYMVGAPGVREASLPSLDAGSRGHVVVGYMGSESAPTTDAAKRTWHGYMTSSTDASARSFHLLSARINPRKDPLLRGQCAQTKCGPVWDFIDVVIDRRANIWGVFVDGCMQLCVRGGAANDASEGFVVRWPHRSR